MPLLNSTRCQPRQNILVHLTVFKFWTLLIKKTFFAIYLQIDFSCALHPHQKWACSAFSLRISEGGHHVSIFHLSLSPGSVSGTRAGAQKCLFTWTKDCLWYCSGNLSGHGSRLRQSRMTSGSFDQKPQ